MLHDSQWQELQRHAARVRNLSIPALLEADPKRIEQSTLRVGGLYANFSRQRIDHDAWQALFGLAQAAGVPVAMQALFDGAQVNVSERRSALHTALRSSLSDTDIARQAHAQARHGRERMAAMLAELDGSDIRDIINVGIGGSDLGPRLACEALCDVDRGRYRVHFLNNADASEVQHLLPKLDPERTAVVLVSKSFGTQETLLNGRILNDWLAGRGRQYAITANAEAALAFGIAGDRVLPMWDWVGGRFSLWSSVGFCVAAKIGMPAFERLLAGAAAMDAHVLQTPSENNLAVRHALTLAWNRDALGMPTHVVLPYDQRLALLPDYLQQLVMESLGKSVGSDGSRVLVATVPMLWGSTGTSAQHSFFQALHQGTDAVPADFVGVIHPGHSYANSHQVQLSNLLAQAEALANGHEAEDPQRRHPGGRPSSMFLLDALTPETLGSLLAMYEHSVYVLSMLWGINAFDQWGVERGKTLAASLLPALAEGNDVAVHDPVTASLLAEIRARR